MEIVINEADLTPDAIAHYRQLETILRGYDLDEKLEAVTRNCWIPALYAGTSQYGWEVYVRDDFPIS